MTNNPSAAVQDYLKHIHQLGGADRVVKPADIVAQMGVKAPSVTGMLKRLAEAGLIDYTPGAGAKLTPAGVAAARRVIRRHRLIELFLTRVLGLDWSEVDAEAEALEHAISPRLEQALAAYLGEPAEDPHGHPIPTPTGELAHRDLRTLAEFRPGDEVVIREAQDDNPDRLRRWRDLGLTPGVTVRILGHEALDDLFEIGVGPRVVRVGSEGLVGLRGEAVGGPDARLLRTWLPLAHCRLFLPLLSTIGRFAAGLVCPPGPRGLGFGGRRGAPTVPGPRHLREARPPMFSMIACNLACLSIAMLFYAWRDALAPKPPSATAHERVAYMLWVSAQRA